jgi:predicted  nucleic acid-binding Zn-ribbon protein
MFAQYQRIANEGMSFLASHFKVPPEADAFDESSALARLMEAAEPSLLRLAPASEPASEIFHWRRRLLKGLIAASILFGISIASYRIGWMRAKAVTATVSNAPLPSALNQVAAENQVLRTTVQTDSKRLEALEQQVVRNKAEAEQYHAKAIAAAGGLTAATADLAITKNQSAAQIAALTQERDLAAERLRNAEKMYQTVQDELSTLRSQHQRDLVHLASLEMHVNSLTADLNDQKNRSSTDEQYLASDKDIRDLIGARNLYIADIMDVNETGQSRKAFGRVFYTKTKSLVFYAYDLDRQPGVKRTSTFQVWGRTSASDRKPINLGILYMDSETNRRWTLRVDNPERLARLDAVFVTIEPHEQPDKPTGKPFLYASLRREPNHP